jgi:DNA modification methylase
MKVSIKDLKHHPLNKKIYSLSNLDELQENISKVGLLQPLTIIGNKKPYLIISGNRRFAVCKNLGFQSVECNKMKVDDTDISLLLVSFNSQRVKTSRELLNEITILRKHYGNNKGKRGDGESARGKISKATGVSSGKIQMLEYVAKHGKEKYIDLIDQGDLSVSQAYTILKRLENEKKSVDERSVRGNKNLLHPKVKIYNKSSHELKEIEDNSIQLVFTSPPYFGKQRIYSKQKNVLGTEKKVEDYIDNLVKHLKPIKRVLKPTGSFYLNLADTYCNGSLPLIPTRVFHRLITDYGFICRNILIWKKSNPLPINSKSNLNPSYEFIAHFVKSKNYYFNPIKIPAKGKNKSTKPPRHRGSKSFSPYIADGKKNIYDYLTQDTIETAVSNQMVNRKILGNVEHPASFVSALVDPFIIMTTKSGDKLLDPFGGSGTCILSGLNFGLDVYYYDINPNFSTGLIKYLKKNNFDIEQ